MADVEPVKQEEEQQQQLPPPSSSSKQNEELEPEQKRKVFIGSLSYNIDENAFRDYWTKFGSVIEATILRDRDGHSRGFGFVTFAESTSVDALMQARPHTLDNRIVEPKRAVPREDTHKPNMQLSVKKLYVGGVKEPITENDLRDYFGQFGNITDVLIMKDRDGQYRGYGFVEFDDYDPVDKIILEKNHNISGRPIDVQKAQSRDGSQRSGNMRSRPGPSSSMSRSNFNSGYNNNNNNNNHHNNNYHPDNYNNGPFGGMPNNNYNNNNNNGYGSNFNDTNGNWTSFGQGYGQQNVGGPMRRGNMGGSGGGRGYSPYNGRGGGRGRGGSNRDGGMGGDGGGGGGGPSWTSWD